LSLLIEFTHRVVAMAAGPLVLAAALMSRRLPGPDRWCGSCRLRHWSAPLQPVPSAD
jgi:heme A synthase